MSTDATRIVISYPEDLSGWGRSQLDTPWFRAYLRKTVGEARKGREWEEFLDVGCCGNSLDVPLRIERVDGGDRFGPDTDIEYTARDACGIRVAGGSRVPADRRPQSDFSVPTRRQMDRRFPSATLLVSGDTIPPVCG